MRQLVQSVSGGGLRHVEHPDMEPDTTGLLVAVRASLISSGTERTTQRLADASLVQKARARPDLVRTVIDRARRDGVRATADAVRARLDEDMPVGYSAAGVVTGAGTAAAGFRSGHRVVTAGVGHADVQAVPVNLAARLPEEVSFEEGAFGAIASVALHGLRLADVGPGSRIVVIGLGLIGQLAVRLAVAMGCDVAGTDPDDWKLAFAAASGALALPKPADSAEAVLDWTRGLGADAVVIAAGTKSHEPMRTAAHVARDRATIVAIGDVGLDLERRPLYDKELTVKVSRAYGPGRYDPVYENLGIDYPIGYVRWPISRNLDAVMRLIASGRLRVKDLVTHRFPFDRAVEAYQVFDRTDPYLGILLEYGETPPDPISAIRLNRPVSTAVEETGLAAGLIGAGRFASGVLLPAAKAAGFGPWTSITSERGVSAVRVGELNGFAQAVATVEDVVTADDTSVVFVASRHDSHAEIACKALAAAKHVFCEKPLAITADELARVIDAWKDAPGVLMAGFNRRWSPALRSAVSFVGRSSPMQIIYRVHAGSLPSDHWLKDRRQGGRLLGEGCHFIDTCNALTGEPPSSVFAIASGKAEALLEESFTVTLEYPSGHQATIVYSAGAPRGAGKERIDVIRGDRAAEIDDFRSLRLRGATATDTEKYKPPDKGHTAEFAVFRDAIQGDRDGDELARSAFETSRVALCAVESLSVGEAVRLEWE